MTTLTCLRCGHSWVPLVVAPRVCPRCKSYTWQSARKPKPPPDPHRVDEPFIARMVAQYAGTWGEGQVREIIATALNHKAVDKAKNRQLYVQGWLRREKERNGNRTTGRSHRQSAGRRAASRPPDAYA